MSRFIVVPIPSARFGIAYAVKDLHTDEVVTAYLCETWANHRAKELNDEVGHGNDTEGEQDLR